MVTNIDLNEMNKILFFMKQYKPHERAPVFSVCDITAQWHLDMDPETSEDVIRTILQTGAQLGFFRSTQDLAGEIFYGYNANMLRANPKNRLILSDSPCLSPCNRLPQCSGVVGQPVTPSNCCYTMNGGSGQGFTGCASVQGALIYLGRPDFCNFTTI